MDKRFDIGVIGGSDGPTRIYVTSDVSWYTIAAIVLAIIAVVVIIIRATINHKRHK